MSGVQPGPPLALVLNPTAQQLISTVGSANREAVLLRGPGAHIYKALLAGGEKIERVLGNAARSVLDWGPEVATDHVRSFLGTGNECLGKLDELYRWRTDYAVVSKSQKSKSKQPDSVKKLEKLCKKVVDYTSGSQTPVTQLVAFRSIVLLSTRYVGLRWLFAEILTAKLPGARLSQSHLSQLWRDVTSGGDLDWEFFLEYAAYCVAASDHVTLAVEECAPSQFGCCDPNKCVTESLSSSITIPHRTDDLSRLAAVRYMGGILELATLWNRKMYNDPRSYDELICRGVHPPEGDYVCEKPHSDDDIKARCYNLHAFVDGMCKIGVFLLQDLSVDGRDADFIEDLLLLDIPGIEQLLSAFWGRLQPALTMLPPDDDRTNESLRRVLEFGDLLQNCRMPSTRSKHLFPSASATAHDLVRAIREPESPASSFVQSQTAPGTVSGDNNSVAADTSDGVLSQEPLLRTGPSSVAEDPALVTSDLNIEGLNSHILTENDGVLLSDDAARNPLVYNHLSHADIQLNQQEQETLELSDRMTDEELGTRQRAGSLIVDVQGAGVPDLSVIRIFAGHNLQTEATFKTVLLNNSTTSSDLIRQAMQRFRLPAGEDENDYYLAVKQLEGSAAALSASEHPLDIFETFMEAAMEIPKVKRSSVGSISSVASNLSMHPAIKKLPMNDFADDSTVKLYINRKADHSSSGTITREDDNTQQRRILSPDETANKVESLASAMRGAELRKAILDEDSDAPASHNEIIPAGESPAPGRDDAMQEPERRRVFPKSAPASAEALQPRMLGTPALSVLSPPVESPPSISQHLRPSNKPSKSSSPPALSARSARGVSHMRQSEDALDVAQEEPSMGAGTSASKQESNQDSSASREKATLDEDSDAPASHYEIMPVGESSPLKRDDARQEPERKHVSPESEAGDSFAGWSSPRHATSAPASERDRILAAVSQLESSRQSDISDLIMTLHKRERALCLFNPEILRVKIAGANMVLDSDDGEEPSRGLPAASSPVPATTVASQDQDLISIARLPAAEIIRIANSPAGLPAVPKADPLVVKATNEFIDELSNKSVQSQKQQLGDKLWRVIRSFGIKRAPKVTITLLDQDDLRSLAHLMNSYPSILKEKALLIQAA
ncbi:hypothetical protein FIBSPDRAFT_939785 [Athelia psychrophila]|uniref:Ras-associating domain-containing protein n=1 Tax=Athelia psychrophila TaxID=1759441 RepID=A0A167X7B9_9AGAM|nr:hypothetical protein FIBSPDRAFT_939785 [Fibularhizoctonia sp. CBS 109695]